MFDELDCESCGFTGGLIYDEEDDVLICPECNAFLNLADVITFLPPVIREGWLHKPPVLVFEDAYFATGYPPMRYPPGSRHTVQALYHMTLIDNLASILKHGLQSRSRALIHHPRQIADEELATKGFSKRENIHGRAISEYVRFYFNPHNKMLKHENLRDATVQSRLIVMQFKPYLLSRPGVISSTRNAITSDAIYNNVESGFDAIKWDIVADQRIFKNRELGELQMAELLVPDQVEIKHLRGITCFNRQTHQQAERLLKEHSPAIAAEVNVNSKNPCEFFP